MLVETKITKNEDGEYTVKLFIDGEYQKNSDYFTNDKEDAQNTAKEMKKSGVKEKLYLYGIDYSCGQSNIDEKGFRFGVISQNTVLQAWADSSEAVYPCDNCECEIGDDDCGEALCDPIGYTLNEDGYIAEDCLQTDIMILKSPFFTCGAFCSPCCPGAINLNEPVKLNDETKAYCFGHDWFDDGKAPYRVFSVETGKEVSPE